MESLQALCLPKQLLRCRYDDHHVGKAIGMMVLIGDIINILSRWMRTRQVRYWLDGVPCHRHIVQANRTSMGCLDGNRILDTIRCDGVNRLFLASLVILTGEVDRLGSYILPIESHLGGGTRSTCGYIDSQRHLLVACRIREYDIQAVPQVDRGLVKEIPSTRIPTVSINLVKRVIVVVGRIERRDKGGRINGFYRLVALGDKIISIIRIRIAGTT